MSKALDILDKKPTNEFAESMVRVLDGQIHFIGKSRIKSDPDGTLLKFERQFLFQRDAWQRIASRPIYKSSI